MYNPYLKTATFKIIIAAVFLSLFSVSEIQADSVFIRGDANIDADINIADPVFVLQYLFSQGETPACPDSSDANDDGSLNLSDAVTILSYLFAGSKMADPNPGCGPDPSDDDTLSECVYTSDFCETPSDPLSLAAQAADTLLFSYLDEPKGQLDRSYFSPDFQSDEFGATELIDLYYFFDDAVQIDHPNIENKKGVQVAHFNQDESLFFYDIYTGEVLPFPGSDTKAITELSFTGGLWANDALLTYYSSLSFLFMELTQQESIQVFTQGAMSEYEVSLTEGELYDFVVDKLLIETETAYSGFPEPGFSLHSFKTHAGEEVPVEVHLAINGNPDETSGPVDVSYRAGLFLTGSPADTKYSVPGDTNVETELENVDWTETPVLSYSLSIPEDLPPGWYNLIIQTENRADDTFYAYDRIILPFEVQNS